MSLLLEALKTLADRPVPADGPATAAQSERTKAVSPKGESPAEQPITASKLETDSEQLLDTAAAAVAASLQEDESLHSHPKIEPASEAPNVRQSEIARDGNWAEVWQQALTLPHSQASIKEETTHRTDEPVEEASNADQSSMSEKLGTIFAPWFEAHGLTNEPAETAPAAELQLEAAEIEAENASETDEAPADETDPQVAVGPNQQFTPTSYSSAIDHEQDVDPTWELYDRSSAFDSSWSQQSAPSEAKKQTEPVPVADSPAPSQAPAETAPRNSFEKLAAKEAPREVRRPADEAVLAREQSPQAPPVKQIAQGPDRRPTAQPAVPRSDLAAELPPAQTTAEVRVSEHYLRLASRLLQSLRTARPQAIVLASADEASSRTLDVAQLAKAITLSEEGKLLFIQAHQGRPDLMRRMGILPDQHPRWHGPAGNEISQRIHCTSQGRIDLLPQQNLFPTQDLAVDPLLIARCKRQYSLVMVDVGFVANEVAHSLAPQGDAALLVAVMQHTPREVAAQSIATLRRLGVRTAGCVLMEPRTANAGSRT